MALAFYLHNIDPIAFPLPDVGFLPEGVRWYGLSYILGFAIAYLLIRRVAGAGRSSVKPEEVVDLVGTLALGVFIGGRVGYCLFYQPRLLGLLDHPPYWGVLAINQGGMASHGGMIGGIAASWWYARRHKHSFAHVLDLFAFGAPLGLFFGRIANFINGELLGRPVAPDAVGRTPWAVLFPQEIYDWPLDRVAALRDAAEVVTRNGLRVHGQLTDPLPWNDAIDELRRGAADLNIPADQWHLLAKHADLPERVRFAYDYVNLAMYRIVEGSHSRDAATLGPLLRPILTPRHPSQLYEALMEGLLLALVLSMLWLRPRRPLLICGMFCLLYGVVRILGEQFRTPDTGIGFQWLGLTRGQWLSIPLALLGLGLVTASTRSKAEPMGGLMKQVRGAGAGDGPAR